MVFVLGLSGVPGGIQIGIGHYCFSGLDELGVGSFIVASGKFMVAFKDGCNDKQDGVNGLGTSLPYGDNARRGPVRARNTLEQGEGRSSKFVGS